MQWAPGGSPPLIIVAVMCTLAAGGKAAWVEHRVGLQPAGHHQRVLASLWPPAGASGLSRHGRNIVLVLSLGTSARSRAEAGHRVPSEMGAFSPSGQGIGSFPQPHVPLCQSSLPG